MKILKESKKESMPNGLVAELVSKGWAEVGSLKETANMLAQDFKNSDKVAGIIQDLADAYLICIGQLELYLSKQGYADTSKKAQNESLHEDVDSVVAELLVDEKEAVDGYNDAIDKLSAEDDKRDVEVLRHIEDEELEHIEELSELVGEDSKPTEPEDDFNCDFDDPVGPAPTDADIYED